MSALLASYFNDLLRDHDGGDQEVLPELVFDNAHLPSPCFGVTIGPIMGTGSEVLDSCHTRSTISTCASTTSNSSTVSAGSTGSNGSSCRWDSNPSSSSKDKADNSLKRPKRPGRKTSDSNKSRSTRISSSSSDDRPVERPSRSNSNNNRRSDKPLRPNRTSSSDKQRHKTTSKSNNTGVDSLGKMLLCKQKATCCSESDASSSENSLKEIFRSASQQRRTATTSNVKPLSGTRASPPRTVNEILGQSMEELKIAW